MKEIRIKVAGIMEINSYKGIERAKQILHEKGRTSDHQKTECRANSLVEDYLRYKFGMIDQWGIEQLFKMKERYLEGYLNDKFDSKLQLIECRIRQTKSDDKDNLKLINWDLII
jgi:hypothetical protein